ncbi:PREDICTED: protein deglycase DJ-1-like [Nicrophorus vespilloides]|uniref:Protein deglycase DJ-1-like n=1 Tax=Nicrophorus vespilloides TaxID=110193 RepID=A0ABM1M724_NICVS|nr:PREDICTED: protein deglycase DJ-1-like [Nicrophorus vespilloides]
MSLLSSFVLRSRSSLVRFSQISRDMSKSALVYLAPGAEEMELVIAVDVLRRGGVNVTVAGLPDKNCVKCSRGVLINPDTGIEQAMSLAPFDALVLPGGLAGSQALAESQEVGKMLKEQEQAGRIIGAICAAPTALKAHGIGVGKNLTSYPSVENSLIEGAAYNYKQDNVVVDGTLITSRGPGTAYNFALTLVEQLVGKEKAQEVAKAMLIEY